MSVIWVDKYAPCSNAVVIRTSSEMNYSYVGRSRGIFGEHSLQFLAVLWIVVSVSWLCYRWRVSQHSAEEKQRVQKIVEFLLLHNWCWCSQEQTQWVQLLKRIWWMWFTCDLQWNDVDDVADVVHNTTEHAKILLLIGAFTWDHVLIHVKCRIEKWKGLSDEDVWWQWWSRKTVLCHDLHIRCNKEHILMHFSVTWVTLTNQCTYT